MQTLQTDVAFSLAELGIKAGAAVEHSQNGPVTILAEGGVVAYLVSAEHYEMLHDAVGEAALTELICQRQKNAKAGDDEAYDLFCEVSTAIESLQK